ncbi:MAG: hypothetical protein IT431_10345 [Phycisphaerales bacterium]|nr:hypothetical protein [Phycisphaerales bacterium]
MMYARKSVVASIPLLLAASAGLAQTQWNNPAGGAWNDALSWDPMNVPASPGESAAIGLAGAYTVTVGAISPNIDALTLANPGAAVAINSARTLQLAALANDGTIVLNANGGGSSAKLLFSASSTITGSGTVLLSRAGSAARLETGAGVTVTNGPSHTIAGYGEVQAALVNEGLLVAQTPGQQLILRDNAKTNNSLMAATDGGVLRLLDLELTQGAGGVLRADGGTILFDPGDSQTIVGGTLESLNGGVFTREFSGTTTLEDVSLDGQLDIISAGVVSVTGAGLTNDGLVLLNPNGAGSSAILRLDNTGVLTGAGIVRLNATGAGALLDSADGVTLTQSAGHTIDGFGQINAAMVNDGLVHADAAGKDIRLAARDKTNNAVMQASAGGILRLLSFTLTQGPGGELVADGGAVILDPGDSQTIVGGTLRSLNGGTITREFSGTTTLEDVSLDGRLDIVSAGVVSVTGAGLTNDGMVLVNADGGGSSAILRMDSNGLLTGAGVVRLNATGAGALLDSAEGVTLTQIAGHTIDGRGQIAAALVNEGLVSANAIGAELLLTGKDKINNAVIQAVDGGTLVFVTQTLAQGPGGVLVADGGMVVFDAGDDQTISGGSLESHGADAFVREFSGVTTLDGVTNRARVEIQSAATLQASPAGMTNDGTIVVNSNGAGSVATLGVLGSGTIGGTGTILFNASVSNSYITAEPGTVATIGAGQTVLGEGRFSGEVIVQGLLSPGLPTGEVFATGGTLVLDTGSTLEIGIETDAVFDSVGGDSDLVVGGMLRVVYRGGYTPAPGDVLTIVDITGSVVGEFDALDLPPVGGGREWRVRYDADAITLVVSCDADFNIDGLVNTLDVLAFLNAWAASDGRADINGDGSVNTLDVLAYLNLWASGC